MVATTPLGWALSNLLMLSRCIQRAEMILIKEEILSNSQRLFLDIIILFP